MKKEKIERIQRTFEWMRYILLGLLLAFFFIGNSSAQTTDDFGMWMSAGTEKKLNDRWNIGTSIELRTKDNSGSVDRWQLAINGAYKVSKFLRLGGNYELHLKNRTVDTGKETVPRHRFMFDISPGIKVQHWLKLSLRERYQYTHTVHKSNVQAINEHHLRHRLKAEIDNSSMKGWSPYLSVEMFNNLSKQFEIDEMRMAIGTTYSIHTRHVVNLGYLLDLKRSAGGLDKVLHVITVGYVYKM